MLAITYLSYTTRLLRLFRLNRDNKREAPVIITLRLIETTIKEEANIISILIAYKKPQKSIYSGNINNGIIITTIINNNSDSNNNKIIAKIISKNK